MIERELKTILTIDSDEEKLCQASNEIDVVASNKLMRETILDLKSLIRANSLPALSAPQIGVNARIFVINIEGDLRTFVDPIITGVKGFDMSVETCVSVPEKRFVRPRNTEVTLTYFTPLGRIKTVKVFGKTAFMVQHQIDHLDGMLLPYVGLEIDKDFDEATPDEQAEVFKMYLESLDIRYEKSKDEINSDKDLKRISDAIDFMEKVKLGKVTLKDAPVPKKEETVFMNDTTDDTKDEE